MPTDPTQPIRDAASKFAGTDVGTACTQSSFKVGGKAFLYIGEQGGRYKAMFKLGDSLAQATTLAEERPHDFQVGNTAWVTARFSAEAPLPKSLWKKWLEESYGLSAGGSGEHDRQGSPKTTKKRTATSQASSKASSARRKRPVKKK